MNTAQTGEGVRSKDVGDKPHRFVHPQHEAVRRCNASRLLPAMLQRVQPEVGKLFRLGMVVDCHHTALVAKFIALVHV